MNEAALPTILSLVEKEPGLSSVDIQQRVRRSRRTVYWALQTLRSQGRITSKSMSWRDMRQLHHFPKKVDA